MTKRGRNMMWSLALVWLVGLFCNMAQAAAPDWLDQVINYPNYTGVLARVYKDGVPIHADGSLLAAFYGDETTPRGAARILGANPDDDIDGEYYFSLLFGSNQAGEKGFKFKLWNSADDTIYDITETLDFDTNYPAKPEIYGGFTTAGFVPCVMSIGDHEYKITVTGGTSDKTKAKAGEIITITANPPASTQALKIWSADSDVEFTGSILGGTTTFEMPNHDVTLTATFIAKSQMQAVAVRSTTNAGDDTAMEPASATGTADKGKFTFTRTSSSGALTVYYTVRGTATNGVDYKSVTGSISFASGKTSVELPIEPLFDGEDEGDETVQVVLEPAPGTQTYRGGAVTDATVVIENIDPDPNPPNPKYTLTVSGGKIDGTNANSGQFAPGEVVTVTATLPSNQGLLKWTPNASVEFIGSVLATTTTVTMPDHDVTLTANFIVKSQMPAVSVKSTANAGDDTATEPTSATAAATDKGKFTFTRTLPSGMTGALTVYFDIRGTATNGVDYKSIPGSVSFASGASSVTLDIEPLFDSLTEGDETVQVVLKPASGTQTYRGGTYTDATVTIKESEPGYVQYTLSSSDGGDISAAQWQINGTWYNSGDKATVNPGTYTVSFKAVSGYTIPDSQSITVTKGNTTNGTAIYKPGDPDYKITVTGGTASKARAKAGEIITITATAPSSTQALKIWSATDGVEFIGSILGATTTFRMPAKDVTLTASFIAKTQMPAVSVKSTANAGDDTATEPTSATAAATDKGKFTFTRTLPSGMTGALTVYFDIRGTATNGVDYKSIPGSVSFASGASSVTLDIEPLFDSLTEGDETVQVVLKPASGTQTYRGGTYTDATVIIKDIPHDEYSITVVNGTSNKATAAEGDTITITANNPPAGKVFDKWTSSDVTISNATSSTTTFTMPNKNVTVTATYKEPGDYHPADLDQNYIISGTEYLNYAGPVKVAALGNYEYDWDGANVLSFAAKTTRSDAAQTRAGNIAITRQASPATYTPGSTVEVTLNISGADKMTNLFIGENIPEGWTVTGAAASSVVDGVLRMTWDKPDIPATFTYTLQAPATNVAASYVIASSAEDTGCFTDGNMIDINVGDTTLINNYNYHPADCINKNNRISGLEYLKYVGPVKALALSNDEYTWDGVDVMSIQKKGATRGGSAADDVALTRSVDLNTYEAGSQVTVTLTISGADSMVSLFIGEKIPEGWTVLGNLADNVRNGILRMTWDAPNIPDTVTYTLQAPAEGLAASCRIASSTVDTGCFTDRVVFLKAEDTVLTWDTDEKPAEWPQDMKLYTPADGKNFRESDKLAVTFSWPAILNADSYRLVIATYDGAVVFDETVKETVCTVSGLACGTFIWNVTANGDGCIAGTVWQDFAFSIVPDTPAPVIVGAVADGTAIRLAFDTTEAGYTDGVFAYQLVFFSLKTYSWISLTQDLQVANGQAVIDLGVEAANGYLYISPVTTPESDFVELYIK